MTYKETRNVVRIETVPGVGFIKKYYDNIYSDTSPRNAKGQLVLRSNAFQRTQFREYWRRNWRNPSSREMVGHPGPDAFPKRYELSDAAAYAMAAAKFRSRLHKGNASLGVTFASMGQSVSMISSKLTLIARVLKRIRTPQDYEKMRRANNRRPSKAITLKKSTKGAANQYLEMVFGWVPLYQDAYSAMEVLAGDLPPQFISTSGVGYDERETKRAGQLSGRYVLREQWHSQCTISARVAVTNPNLWLMNRLGLVNPAVVAWDLVPWSFVVNMFVNVTSILSSYSEFVGLAISDMATTRTRKGMITTGESCVVTIDNESRYGYVGVGSQHLVKTRTLGGTLERPKLTFKVPQLNLGLALTSMALVRQQASRISSFVDINKTTE